MIQSFTVSIPSQSDCTYCQKEISWVFAPRYLFYVIGTSLKRIFYKKTQINHYKIVWNFLPRSEESLEGKVYGTHSSVPQSLSFLFTVVTVIVSPPLNYVFILSSLRPLCDDKYLGKQAFNLRREVCSGDYPSIHRS